MKLKSILFYVGFALLGISTLIKRSALFNLPDSLVVNVAPIIACILFVIKFFLDKHSKKEFIIHVLIMFAVVLLRLNMGLSAFVVTSVFAFMTIQGIDIKKIIKLDILIKSFFLLSHALVFTIDYLMNTGEALDYINYFIKGTSISLYFVNPNTTGLLGTCIALDMLFLKKDKTIKDFVAPTVIAVATFLVTVSRTPFLIYILYILLQFIRNGKVLTIIQRTIYPVLCLVTFMMVNFLSFSSPIFKVLNPLMSGRLSQSINAYNALGMNILPNASQAVLLEKYTIDVFYVKCFVDLGLITMLLYYLPNILLPTDSDSETKRISIIACVYLLFESVIANVGFAIPFLVLADAFYNKGERHE